MKKTISLLLALVMLLSLASCGGSNNPGGSSGSTSGNGNDTPGGSSGGSGDRTVTLGWTQAVEGFEPAFANNGIGFALVYENLFENNPDTGELEGQLVESYEWLDDTTLQLTLKEGITFSNGDPMTPEDVLWSLQYYIEVGSNLSTYYTNYDWDNCQIIDDRTFTFKYFEPYGPALNYLTLPKIQNKSYYEEFGEDAYWDSPCGSGPYTVVENVSGSHSTYQLRDDYWGEKPEAEQIIVKTYSEASTMYIDFENGALDIAFGLSANDAQRAQDGSGSGYTAVLQSDLDCKMLCLANYKTEFQDARVREAIAIGVEWDQVGAAAFGVLATPSTSTLPAGVRYKIDTAGYTYDPDRARQLLADAGYADGFTIDLVLVNDTTNQRMAEAIQAYLSAMNITLNIESYEIATAIPMFMSGQTDCIIKTAQGGATCLEPDQIYDTLKASSTLVAAAVQDSTFDGYLMKGLYTSDESEREQLYVNAQNWLYENMWAIPICDTMGAYVYKDGISLKTVSMTYPNLRFIHFT